jgi:hypothetical protein
LHPLSHRPPMTLLRAVVASLDSLVLRQLQKQSRLPTMRHV